MRIAYFNWPSLDGCRLYDERDCRKSTTAARIAPGRSRSLSGQPWLRVARRLEHAFELPFERFEVVGQAAPVVEEERARRHRVDTSFSHVSSVSSTSSGPVRRCTVPCTRRGGRPESR
jgi:hypothetical protein